MGNTALIVIYNHKYEKNIDKIEYIYKKRFNHIFHIIPFYTGSKENVIPVYENSYYFQSYITQAFKSFYKETFDHFLFIADDLILNPVINEDNYSYHFKLEPDTSYITKIYSFHKAKDSKWHRMQEAFNFSLNVDGVEINTELPSFEIALNKFSEHGFELKPLIYKQIFRKPPSITKIYQVRLLSKHILWHFKAFIQRSKQYNLKYPLVGGYSDIFIIPNSTLKKFCHYCGIFAVARLFVEIAIPTSLLLSSRKVVFEQNLQLKGNAIWNVEELSELDKYEFRIDNLLNNFPKSLLFIHPVKLSKWE